MHEDGLFEAWYDGFVMPSMPRDGAFVRMLHVGDELLYGAVLTLLVAFLVFLGLGWGVDLAVLAVSAAVSVVLLWIMVPVPPLCEPQSLAEHRL